MLDDTVVALRQAGNVEDPLTDLLRAGARQLLAQAVEAEVADMLSAHDHLRTEDGRRRLVRHGHGPEREILTGIGPVPVRPGQASRSRRGRPERTHPLHVGHSAAVRTAHPVASYGRFWVPILGDDRSSGGVVVDLDHLDAIAEFDSLDELGQLIFTLQHPPASGRGGYQHKDHSHGGGMREAPLGPDRAVSDRSEDAFDRVGRAQMHPVLGGEVVEGQQVVLILGQAGESYGRKWVTA